MCFQETPVPNFQVFSIWLHILLGKQHRLNSGRIVSVCVFVGEIRQVNLPRSERAHLLILLPQITKKGTDRPYFCFSAAVFCEHRVRPVLEDIMTETGCTLKQGMILKPFSERDLFF